MLSTNTAEVGQSRVEMPVPFNEDELTITLDHRYVADFLKALMMQPDKTISPSQSALPPAESPSTRYSSVARQAVSQFSRQPAATQHGFAADSALEFLLRPGFLQGMFSGIPQNRS